MRRSAAWRWLPVFLGVALGLATLLRTALPMGLSAQSLLVRLDGDSLRVSAPQLQFLTGKPLERLKDGASVAFLAQLSISTDANSTVHARSIARFAMSQDIWDERFKVTKIDAGGQAERSASHLSTEAAQAWCLDNLSIDAAGLPADKPFWVRLEIRAEDPRDQAGVVGDGGINLTRLLELFSHPARAQQPRWTRDAGPLRLADLKKGTKA